MNVRMTLMIGLLVAVTPVARPLMAQSPAASADTLTLDLAAAIQRGFERSEEVRIARSQAREAGDQVRDARSALFPQLGFNVSYQRTLRSPLGASGFGAFPDSLRFTPDSTASTGTRLGYLEQHLPDAVLENLSGLFSGFPLGRKNTWVGHITVRQTLFNGSVFAGLSAAREYAGLARAQESEAEAELRLQITEAYYNAVLADRLAAITDSTVAQLDEQLAQVTLTRAAGNASDLDLLRVQVDRENLQPQLVAALNQRDLALLNLKRLINIGSETPVLLTDGLGAAGLTPLTASQIDALVAGALERRARIQAAERQVAIQEQQVRASRAAYLPTVAVNATFGKQALPSGVFPSGGDWRDDWSVGIGVQVPLFTGGSRGARSAQAREQLEQSKLQLTQVREIVTLDVEQQRGELRRADALITARAQTTGQARRVYSLTDLAYRQGVSTYLQLTDARLALSQARANEAQAVHAYYIALARLHRAAGR